MTACIAAERVGACDLKPQSLGAANSMRCKISFPRIMCTCFLVSVSAYACLCISTTGAGVVDHKYPIQTFVLPVASLRVRTLAPDGDEGPDAQTVPAPAAAAPIPAGDDETAPV